MNGKKLILIYTQILRIGTFEFLIDQLYKKVIQSLNS